MPHRQEKLRPLHAMQRGTAAKIIIELLLAIQAAYSGVLDDNDDLLGAVLGCAVLVGQADGNPMTISDLAAYTGVPRPTVIRRINRAQQTGRICRIQVGRRTTLWLTRVNDPGVVDAIMKAVRRATRQFNALSKMDSTHVAAHG